MAKERIDRELEEFRGVMQAPSTFEDGFNWSSFLGALFIGFLMVPGAMYMALLAGQGIGPAAQWVTVILFIEVARRAHRQLKGAEVFVLFFMAGAMMLSVGMGGQIQGLLWNQFYVRSDSAINMGIAELLPTWFAPAADSPSYASRTFFHWDWLPAIGLLIFGAFFGQLNNMVLGYGLFRLTSDIEKLPFPMAPIGAQGILALAEDIDEKAEKGSEGNWRWRVFAIGGALGLAFGAVYLLLPTLTGALTGEPIMIFPIPWSDFTTKTADWLPAVATGMSWDFGQLITGMVLPFFGMLGSFIALVATFVVNPILHHPDIRILHSWTRDQGTIETLFVNNVDFYFSFGIGISIAIAGAGFWEVYKGIKRRRREAREQGVSVRQASAVPKGRGDIKGWLIVASYIIVTMAYIIVSGFLIDWHPWVMVVLFFLGFVYTPLISYVTARLEGMVGQVVEIPMIREASLILSGYQGVAVWFIPIPMANYGSMTVFYRQCELTGTKFTSIWKAQIILYPIILLTSIFFANFIWGLAEVPSAVYPFAQEWWELDAANRSIMYSSTLGDFSIFEEAFKGWYVAAGAGFGLSLFAVMTFFGTPVFFIYGFIRGLGQAMPHAIIPQFIGALIGRYYFQRKLGLKWRQYIPVVAAGFFCGQGLITTVGVGITFLSKAVIQMPF
ncbi:MAG: peptide transporter [Phycisphaerae bacterium]|nr:peptide transporter [Phycisphaerae bacterium]